MLGIQLIPMGPVLDATSRATRTRSGLRRRGAPGGFGVQFGDYLLMYSALAGEQQRKTALATAEKLDEKWIDDETVGPTCWPG